MPELKRIFCRYEEASGQKINTDKSSVFFSPNTSQNAKEEILDILGPMQDSKHTKYLGLPSFIGRSKTQVFSILKERIGWKLAGWKGKLLSMGGKEVLIKAVAQVIPVYTMSCFQLPQSLCDDLESMMRSFWWGQKQNEAKMSWVSWKRMCISKVYGGMGFRNLRAFNQAMLPKQAWRILSNPTSLVARDLRSKYFPTSDVLSAKLGCSPSYSWRSIHSNLEVIKMDIIGE
ncbi:putative mitochondrial protein AtMg00310 [Castanea sativa]|uniref:putative mitochondrial protein AtMg00310 n=1 Tax=Castanea sativa TaxID=21020 RepID=UPI003F64B686